ncbi:MAG TPA: hypothetical protein DEA08_04760 [Planctomycetes bacterium]|nr:hypothetical protein [Planctomycetota bacterium]
MILRIVAALALFAVAAGGTIVLRKRGHEGEADAHAAAEGQGEGGPGAEEEVPETEVEEDFELPRPYQGEELAALVHKLEQKRKDYQERLARLEEREKALDRYATELDARRSELEEVMGDVEQRHHEIDTARTELAAQQLSLDAGEAEALRPLAKTYETLRPAAAAERLEKLEIDTIAKLLNLMRSRSAGKVLEALSPAKAALVSRRLVDLRQQKQEDKNGSS